MSVRFWLRLRLIMRGSLFLVVSSLLALGNSVGMCLPLYLSQLAESVLRSHKEARANAYTTRQRCSDFFHCLVCICVGAYMYLHGMVVRVLLRCLETLFISHENANFLFSVRVVQGEAKTPKMMECCRANFAFLHALKIGTFRGKWTQEWVFKTSHFVCLDLYFF